MVRIPMAPFPPHRPGSVGQRPIGGSAERGDRFLKGVQGDAVATAKKDMPSGEMLDGEGGFAVWAKAILAARSLELGALPMGLAHNVRLKRPIKKDQVVSYVDVDLVNDRDVAAVRHEIEDRFKPLKSVAAQ